MSADRVQVSARGRRRAKPPLIAVASAAATAAATPYPAWGQISPTAGQPADDVEDLLLCELNSRCEIGLGGSL